MFFWAKQSHRLSSILFQCRQIKHFKLIRLLFTLVLSVLVNFLFFANTFFVLFIMFFVLSFIKWSSLFWDQTNLWRKVFGRAKAITCADNGLDPSFLEFFECFSYSLSCNVINTGNTIDSWILCQFIYQNTLILKIFNFIYLIFIQGVF